MIDLHCHILPGFDDGPSTLEESLAMCRLAADDGIATIVATPHYKPGSCDWGQDNLVSAVSKLQEAVSSAGIGLKILAGAEAALFPELPRLLRESRFLTINSGCYFLIEFRPLSLPSNVGQFLQSLLDLGLIPIIAHPERCEPFLKQPALLANLVKQGAMIQLTAGSITNQYGPAVRAFSLELIKKGLAQIIASDAHDCNERSPRLSEAVSLVADLVGQERARSMVTTTPAAILASQPLRLLPPAEYCEPPQSRPSSWLRRILGAAA